jgi:hypothetical protein
MTYLTATVIGLSFGSTAVAADEKPDYAALAAQIKKAVLARMPKEYEDLSEWGQTIPLPTDVRFPRLRRTVIRKGDRLEVPHGVWRRTKVWVADPNRDLQIRLADVRKAGKDTTRVRVEALVTLRGSRERVRWAKGVQLFDITADADAVVAIGLDCNVKVSFDLKKLPPELRIEPKVTAVQLDLKEFNIRRVGPVLVLEQGELGEELKRSLQEKMKAYEPQVKEYANKALAESLKNDKGLFSPPGLKLPGK